MILAKSPGIVNLKPGEVTSLLTGKAATIRMTGKAAGNAAVTYTASGLPTGMSINATTGVISGTPSRTGSFTAHVVSHTSSTPSNDYKFKITVAKPTITLSLPSSPIARKGQSASIAVTAVDSAGEAVTFGATGLPAGLSINTATGTISGKPKSSVAIRSYTVTISASDPGGASATGSFSLQITS